MLFPRAVEGAGVQRAGSENFLDSREVRLRMERAADDRRQPILVPSGAGMDNLACV